MLKLFMKGNYYTKSQGFGVMPLIKKEYSEIKNRSDQEQWVFMDDDRLMLKEINDFTLNNLADVLELTESQRALLRSYCHAPWHIAAKINRKPN